MSLFRLLLRWALTIFAILLALLAVLVLTLRLAAGELDRFPAPNSSLCCQRGLMPSSLWRRFQVAFTALTLR